VKTVLLNTARDLGSQGFDTTYGRGLLQAGVALRQAAAPAQTPPADRTVYVYADRSQANGSFEQDPNNPDPRQGRAVVILPAGQRTVDFKITRARDGGLLQAGTYRVVACINTNSNGYTCDPGDTGGIGAPSPISYTGAPVVGVNVTVTPLP
jgi:hypothetical protein